MSRNSICEHDYADIDQACPVCWGEDDPRPLHEQGEGQATYIPFDSEYEALRTARIRMKVRDVVKHVWSPRLAYWEAEKHVALGSIWIAIDFTEGREVESAAIVLWLGN